MTQHQCSCTILACDRQTDRQIHTGHNDSIYHARMASCGKKGCCWP